MNQKKRKQIPLFDIKLSPQTKREVAEVLSSGWLTSGPKVQAFEKAVARLLKVKYTTAVSSCTVGLHLTLGAIGIQPDRFGAIKEVITTPFTFVATVEAILQAGAKPVFADINPHTLNIDPDEVARKVSKQTMSVIPVDIAGYPNDYHTLNSICDTHSLLLIADAAHSIGAAYKKRTIPNLCDAAVTSFYSTKNLTCGEGGMVFSRHKQLIDRIRLMARHGLTTSTFERKTKKKVLYDAVIGGYKGNMSELHAAIGLGQLTLFKKNQEVRTLLAERYLNNLSTVSEFIELPPIEKGFQHGWHLFIIKLHLSRLNIDREKFLRLMAARGIECGVHYQPIFNLSWYRKYLGLSPQHFPNAAYAGRRVVSLPLYPALKKTEVDYVCENITDIIKRHRR